MNNTNKENEWNEEYRKFMVDFYPKSSPVVSTWQIYLQACRARQSEYLELKEELEKARELIEAQSKFLNRFKDGFYLNNSYSELVSLYKDLTDFEIKEFLKIKENE